jgi:sigma-B regulation protein RsbU (phosphoserine phosphatase)
LRRRCDPLFVYFGIFAALYGLRLWVQTNILGLVLPTSVAYARLRPAINYLVPIPFVLYFRAAGFLLNRLSVVVACVLAIVDGALAIFTLSFGPRVLYERINTISGDRCIGDSDIPVHPPACTA